MCFEYIDGRKRSREKDEESEGRERIAKADRSVKRSDGEIAGDGSL